MPEVPREIAATTDAAAEAAARAAIRAEWITRVATPRAARTRLELSA